MYAAIFQDLILGIRIYNALLSSLADENRFSGIRGMDWCVLGTFLSSHRRECAVNGVMAKYGLKPKGI